MYAPNIKSRIHRHVELLFFFSFSPIVQFCERIERKRKKRENETFHHMISCVKIMNCVVTTTWSLFAIKIRNFLTHTHTHTHLHSSIMTCIKIAFVLFFNKVFFSTECFRVTLKIKFSYLLVERWNHRIEFFSFSLSTSYVRRKIFAQLMSWLYQ